jgi:hypothetical protein
MRRRHVRAAVLILLDRLNPSIVAHAGNYRTAILYGSWALELQINVRVITAAQQEQLILGMIAKK